METIIETIEDVIMQKKQSIRYANNELESIQRRIEKEQVELAVLQDALKQLQEK